METRFVKASDFKAKCLKIMDEVAETGEAIIITKNGEPVAQLEPVRRKPEQAFGAMKGWIEIPKEVDLTEPTGGVWDSREDEHL